MKLFRDVQGGTMVEMALVLPIFLTLVLGLIEVGIWMWAQQSLQFACDEAGRYAMTNFEHPGYDPVAHATAAYASIGTPAFAAAMTEDTPDYVTITGTYVHSFFVPTLLGFDATVTIQASSMVPLNPQ